jgi:hypothetical protein
MRRGLMAWDQAEVPKSALEQRLAVLRAVMKDEGFDALVLYTNIARGASVWWLTGFTPYWNEGLLHVPAQGEMVFATALSKRVAEWIESVMPAGQVVTTPKPAALISAGLVKDGAKRIGVLELDDFPAGHAKIILETVPGAQLIDATSAFARVRSGSDAVERGLLVKADALARASCAAVELNTPDARAFMAPCETVARLGGAEECFALASTNLGASRAAVRTEAMGALGATFAARISLAYKGAWTRHARSFARDEKLQEAFDAAHARLMNFKPTDMLNLSAVLAKHFEGLGDLVDFTIEQPRGSYPLAAVANHAGTAEGFNPAAPFVLDVELQIKGARWLGAHLVGL